MKLNIYRIPKEAFEIKADFKIHHISKEDIPRSKQLEPLRVCGHCGLEAFNKEDLYKFVKSKTAPHGRSTLCKACFNKYQHERKETDDRVYLKNKYNDMVGRCYNSKHIRYTYYGNRGITVCDEWLNNSDLFVDWAFSSGWTRELEINRVDNNGSYSPSNCCWSTRLEQQRNRRNTVTFPEKGTRICCKCKIEKPLIDFQVDRAHTCGRRYNCKECGR